ncbi:MAG: YbaB/EbfC family nucleoid-associated protein [Chloroflexaceae bacterium]|nr:YbaB/EbfC family nucleoid-associated protein [Chloroflexaceae bacterium]
MNEQKGFGFGFGKMRELADAFRKAQQVSEGAKQLQEELEQMEVWGESEDGRVRVAISGNQEPRRVEIDPLALDLGAEALAVAVTAAMQDAYRKSTETMREKMEALTGSLTLPGL